MYFTERLMLRSFDVDADKAMLIRWMNEPEFRWGVRFGLPYPYSRDEAKAFFDAHFAKCIDLPGFALCLRPPEGELPSTLSGNDDLYLKDGKPRYPMIGVLNLHAGPKYNFSNQTTAVGIAFSPDFRGHGFGTETLTWLLSFIFKDMNLHRCELTVGSWNARAIRCYEKVGFVVEGRQRECVWRDGKREDSIMMAVLRPEWEARQAALTSSKKLAS